MHGLRGNESVPSLPPPRPKSPPEYPDLYGKRRELARLQVLEREIGFLEEEVRSVEGLQLASKSCKEVLDFVTCNADPLIPLAKKTSRSHCFWKWLCTLCRCSKPCQGSSSSCWSSPCCNKCKCSCNCCMPPRCPSCSVCSTIKCRCYPNCPTVNMCSCCDKTCCFSFCFCY